MAVKLHRCGTMWLKIDAHPCWKVQKALDEAGIDYEVVKHPNFPRGRRKQLEEISGQKVMPVLELEDGTTIREDSSEMVERIKAGDLKTSGPGVVGRLLGRDR